MAANGPATTLQDGRDHCESTSEIMAREVRAVLATNGDLFIARLHSG
jgi:hypothetical protein